DLIGEQDLHFFFFSSRRRHTRFSRDWSSDVCSSDLPRYNGRPGSESHKAEPWVATPYLTEGQAPASGFRLDVDLAAPTPLEDVRSEERRVGKVARSRWPQDTKFNI